MSQLFLQNVEFLSAVDEELFFIWLEKIASVTEVVGAGDSIKISVASPVLDHDLRELIALSYRYKTDMRQLRVLLTERNKKWFSENVEAYWHSEVFL